MNKELRNDDRQENVEAESRSPEQTRIQGNGDREFYTVSQLADLLQLKEMTIYKMINRGELPCYAIGRMKRFRRGDVEEFLEQCRVPGAGKRPTT